MFLLAQEDYVPGWSGSGKMSAFEGGSERRETAEINAVREFLEESIAVLVDGPDEARSLLSDLESKKYALRIRVQDARRNEEHCTFVKQFQWSPDIFERFEQRRKLLIDIQDHGASLKRLENAVPHRYPFLRHDDVYQQHGTVSKVRDVQARIVSGGGIMEVHVLLETACSQFHRRFAYGPVCIHCHNFVKMTTLRRMLPTTISKLPPLIHKALCVTTTSSGAHIKHVTVKREWLEKACIHECSLAQLDQHLHARHNLLRPNFELVARQVVAQFRSPATPFSVVHNSS